MLRESWPHAASCLCIPAQYHCHLPAPCYGPPPAPPPQEQPPSPRPALTSEPLGVVLGGAEWGLRPEASVNHSITGLEIRSCG